MLSWWLALLRCSASFQNNKLFEAFILISQLSLIKWRHFGRNFQNLRRCKKINSRLKLEQEVCSDKTPWVSYYDAFLLYPQRNVSKHLTCKLLFPFHWLIDVCRVSLCNPGCPWTHCRHFASSSPVLRLQACTTQSKRQFSLFYKFVWMCELCCVWVWWMCTCMYRSCVHRQRPDSFWPHSVTVCIFSFITNLTAGWQSSNPSSPFPHSAVLPGGNEPCLALFKCGFWDPNSGPCSCIASHIHWDISLVPIFSSWSS